MLMTQEATGLGRPCCWLALHRRGSMPHSVIYDPQDQIVAIRYFGNVDLAALQAGIGEAAPLAVANHCRRILIDCRAAELTFTTLEIYELPGKVAGAVAPSQVAIQEFKRALVIGGQAQAYSFLETVMRNRMQNIMIFASEEAARSWLLAQ